jgi:hypothetical protein
MDLKEEAVQLLLEFGADLTIPDSAGLSPLNLTKLIGRNSLTELMTSATGI